MKRHTGPRLLPALLLAALLPGCLGDKSTSLDVAVAPEPGTVGSQQCVSTCHAATRDHITGLVISETWAASQHLRVGNVQCEDCHGGGGNHYGVGPIPYPVPTTTCAACHGMPGFTGTAHYNNDAEPAALFFQADAGTGQATYFGQPEFRPDNATPVTRAEHVEQCSRCHNPSQRFAYNADNTLSDPDPALLPVPRVTCGGCHDGHDPADNTLVPQRTAKVNFPRFRSYLVDPASGAQTDNAAVGVELSTVNLIHQTNGAVYGLAAPATPIYARVVGTNNEIHPDRLCAVCHAKGKYLYSGAATHQEDIHGQWSESGHGHREAAAFAEFSANPPAYLDASGDPYPIGDHMATYPFDMGKSATPGATATTSRNASYRPVDYGGTSTSYVNNYACYKCHHGLGSLAYQDNVEGTPDAPVLFGDVTVTCLTCHDPHTDVTGQTKNTRRPVVMTKYAFSATAGSPASNPAPLTYALSFSGNVFYDNTPVPTTRTGNATICVFCHQGRESGFTLFKRRIQIDNTVGTAGANTFYNFINPHYLGTGAMLWARNAYEYGGKLYGENRAHQDTNCIGCHMAPGRSPVDDSVREDLGGHTWHIFAEADNALNSGTCNQAACHNGEVGDTRDALISFRASTDTNDYDGDGDDTEGIAQEIEGLSTQLVALLQANGIYYSDILYPYFFTDGTYTTGFLNWKRPTLKAAFNLALVIKGLPSSPVSQIGRPNPSAAAHNYRYIIQILRDSYDDLAVNGDAPGPVLGGVRPTGTRPATNYDPQPGGGYDPNQ